MSWTLGSTRKFWALAVCIYPPQFDGIFGFNFVFLGMQPLRHLGARDY